MIVPHASGTCPSRAALLCCVVLVCSVRAAEPRPAPSLHVPFDGSCEVKGVAFGPEPRVLGDIEWQEGVRGAAASLGDECGLEIPAREGPVLMGFGTVMFWINPRWSMRERRRGQVAFVRWMAGRSGVPHFGRLYKDNGGDNLTFDLTLAKNFYRCAAPLTLRPGKWTHLALTWHIDQDAGAVEAALYRDGTPIARAVRARTTASLRAMPPEIALGLTRRLLISAPGKYAMCAAIDEVRLFPQVLSAAQVRECYRDDAAGIPTRK